MRIGFGRDDPSAMERTCSMLRSMTQPRISCVHRGLRLVRHRHLTCLPCLVHRVHLDLPALHRALRRHQGRVVCTPCRRRRRQGMRLLLRPRLRPRHRRNINILRSNMQHPPQQHRKAQACLARYVLSYDVQTYAKDGFYSCWRRCRLGMYGARTLTTATVCGTWHQ